MTVGRLVVPVALVCLALGGCASTDTAGAHRQALAGLQRDVLSVSRAGASRDLPAATAALASLRSHLDAARRSGRVSPAEAARIEAAADRVSADLAALAAPPVRPVASPAPSPSATPRPKPSAAPLPKRPPPIPKRPHEGHHDKGGHRDGHHGH
ncbi:hypothetical protein [Oryzihumus leptocrescens]|uniref:Lipoprotein n=1 Tax=Oryzihumus leptocrescens TaxID=297536 RepID=A0A542ZKZ3_9MICO|nr:hypothetical protein [Oryzihumus leptocrescens]TQL61015.1 hypothetical protein FB474_2419 [Oryzihumus leptocrescens]